MIINSQYAVRASEPEPENSQFPGSRTAISGLRYYSPSLGRFINRDPSEEQGGLNLYGFCLNNGVNRWDYLGMDSKEADGGGEFGFAAGAGGPPTSVDSSGTSIDAANDRATANTVVAVLVGPLGTIPVYGRDLNRPASDLVGMAAAVQAKSDAALAYVNAQWDGVVANVLPTVVSRNMTTLSAGVTNSFNAISAAAAQTVATWLNAAGAAGIAAAKAAIEQRSAAIEQKVAISAILARVRPIPLVDDAGNAIIGASGEIAYGPTGYPLQQFARQGSVDATIDPLLPMTQLVNFRQGGGWDLQRVGGDGRNITDRRLIDGATIAMGVYSAAARIPFETLMKIQDNYAARNSRFGRVPMDQNYPHLPVRNVENTKIGYDLVKSGAVKADSPGRRSRTSDL